MSETEQPNVLVILSDQHRYDCIGAYGNSNVRTPFIDQLSNDGVTFDSSFCPYPVCAPSRYSMLTSLYPHQHSAWDNEATLPPGIATFPEAFRDAGYHTTALGKMHLTPTYATVGFEEMILAEQHGPGRHDDDYHRYLRDSGLVDKNDLTDQVEEFRSKAPGEYWDTFGALSSNLSEKHHSTTWIADRAVETISQWDKQPQLMFISFIKPHHPFDPPSPWDKMYDPETTEILPGWTDQLTPIDSDRGPGYFPNDELTTSAIKRVTAYYYGAISHMDHHIGRIIDELKRQGLYEDTIIVYASDHGEFMGFHHLLLKHNYMYEPLVRVPLIMKLPGNHKRGTRQKSLVSLLDLGPTLGALSSVSLPKSMVGQDIFSSEDREFIFAEYEDEYMVRTHTHKLLRMRDEERSQLIDLEKDPLEIDNLYFDPSYSQIRTDLEQKLEKTVLFDTRPPLQLDTEAPFIKAYNALGPRGPHREESLSYFRQKMSDKVKRS